MLLCVDGARAPGRAFMLRGHKNRTIVCVYLACFAAAMLGTLMCAELGSADRGYAGGSSARYAETRRTIPLPTAIYRDPHDTRALTRHTKTESVGF